MIAREKATEKAAATRRGEWQAKGIQEYQGALR
jgi:hypothetical protein